MGLNMEGGAVSQEEGGSRSRKAREQVLPVPEEASLLRLRAALHSHLGVPSLALSGGTALFYSSECVRARSHSDGHSVRAARRAQGGRHVS